MSKKLEDLDLREVSERTHIEPEFFQALMDRDFAEMSRFNVEGFFKILKREYELDLSDLLAEFRAFTQKDEKKPEKAEKPKAAPPPPRNPESKIVTNVEQYGKESSGWWLWALIVLVAAAIIYLVWAYDLFKAFVNEPSTNASSEVLQSIDEAQNSVVVGAEGNVSVVELGEEPAQNLNSQNLNAENSAQKAEENATQGALPQKPAQNLNALLNSNTKANEAVFSTEGKVWVGFIDLTTRANSSMLTDSNFSVDLSKDQLLLIGGTALTLVNESGEVLNFPSGSSKRFLVKEGKIRAINDKEFRSYNGGKDW
jgi:cytoskeletal protein RodZ